MNIKQLCGWIPPCYLLLQPPLAPAEVITDGTLGCATNLSAPDYRIGADLGQQHGGNLFHSFSQFNLKQGETATFSGPDNVTNIVSRVTGGTRSDIDGTIRSEIPQANLFFFNPMGILFGPHASLDVTGAVHVTTADYLKLGENGRFDATHPEKSILSVAPPSAFGFLGSQPATIVVEGLASAKQTVSLTGGDISIKGTWQAANGPVTLNSVAGPGEVSITTPMTNPTEAIAGGNITLLSGAKISTDTKSEARAGDIVIRAGNLTLQEVATITSNTTGQGSGSAGTITIQANHLTMQGTKESIASEISSQTANHGGASGKIEIVAKEGLDMRGRGSLSVSASDTNQRAGNIVITTPKLTLADDATIDARSNLQKGSGGGEISIKVQTLTMTGKTAIVGDTANSGPGGNISIVADTISLSGESVIASLTTGKGRGGNVTIIVTGATLFLYDSATITTDTTAEGTAGNITLKVNNLVVAKESRITSDPQGNNAYVQKRLGQAKLANQLGAQSNGEFTGGGKPGKVCINQSGQDCDSHSTVALTRTVTAPPQFRSCPEKDNPNALITTKPQGVTRGLEDLF